MAATIMADKKKPSLTKRQQEIYEFLRDQIQSRGYGPTVREIGEHFGIKSPNGVMCHLKALERKGLIRRDANMSRAICLSDVSSPSNSVPFIGTAVAGNAFAAAVSSDDKVCFEKLLNGPQHGCVLVKGASFQSLGINDGDQVIVERGGNAVTGDLLAALDKDHRFTICTILGDGQQPTPAVPGQIGSPKQILGVIVGVVRQLRFPPRDA